MTLANPQTVLDLSHAPPDVRVRDLSVTLRGGKSLYAGLSLDVPAAKTTCILGPSGVGKTILLRLILGLARPGDGSIEHLEGHIDAEDMGGLDDRAAYMGQSDLLLPWLSVADNVSLGARLRGKADASYQHRAAELLGSVGLTDEATALPDTLSGGMRQRVALARTLFEDRPLVCMDEPFSKLDAITKLKLQDLTAKAFAGKTVLLVTHDPLEALRLGHRVVVLGGSPSRVIDVHDLPGTTARDVTESGILRLQSELLRALAQEDA